MRCPTDSLRRIRCRGSRFSNWGSADDAPPPMRATDARHRCTWPPRRGAVGVRVDCDGEANTRSEEVSMPSPHHPCPRSLAATVGRATTIEERFVAGDPSALGSLLAANGPRLRAQAERILNDRHLSDDALSMALFKAWSTRHTYDPSRPIGPWLYGIVRRCSIDIARYERRRAPVAARLVEDQPDPDVMAVDRSIDTETVRRAVGLLPASEREVIIMYHFLGFSQAEIALAQGVPVGTVKSRSNRARGRLRASLHHLQRAPGRPRG